MALASDTGDLLAPAAAYPSETLIGYTRVSMVRLLGASRGTLNNHIPDLQELRGIPTARALEAEQS